MEKNEDNLERQELYDHLVINLVEQLRDLIHFFRGQGYDFDGVYQKYKSGGFDKLLQDKQKKIRYIEDIQEGIYNGKETFSSWVEQSNRIARYGFNQSYRDEDEY